MTDIEKALFTQICDEMKNRKEFMNTLYVHYYNIISKEIILINCNFFDYK